MRKKNLLWSLLVGIFLLSFQCLAFSSEQKEVIKQSSLIKTAIPHDRFSLATFTTLQSHKSGGGLEIGFLLWQKNQFFLRNHNTINLYLTDIALSHGTGFSISERLFFGAFQVYNGFLFRTYVFFDTAIILAKDKKHAFLNTPFILEMGGAGGFEFYFLKDHSLFIEFGGGMTMTSFRNNVPLEEIAQGSFAGSYASLTAGMRHYF